MRVLWTSGAAVALVIIAVVPVSAQARSKASPDDTPEGWTFRWADHPRLKSARLQLDFRGQLFTVGADSNGPVRHSRADAFDFARKRFGIDGEFAHRLDFQVEAELDRDDPARDIYADFRASRALRMRGGYFKLPFGLEENTSQAKLEFIYRTLMSDRLAPGRDTGGMLHGRAGMIGYETGVFLHDGRNARPLHAVRVHGGATIAGRLTVEPFRRSKRPARDVHIAVAVSGSSLPEGYSGVRGRTVLGAAFFDSDLWVMGDRRRIGLELGWRPGRFAFISEAMHLSDERREQALDRTDLPRWTTQGWYVSGTWVVFGATRASNVDTPRKPLHRGGPGSLQIGARQEALRFGALSIGEAPLVMHRAPSIHGARDAATTLGVNWWATRWTRLQANLIHERLSGVLADEALPTRLWNRVIRFQVVI